MKITIRTKSHPEEQTFICDGFRYPEKSDNIWLTLTDKDGDVIYMFAVEDVLYVGINY